MQKIVYTSPYKIEWDAQSAFKLTNYYTDDENCMVFCYLKQYVQNKDLKLCTFCFDKEPTGKNDLQLCFNLNPEDTSDFFVMEFGIDGIASINKVYADSGIVKSCNDLIADIAYHPFRSNDQQGFYWCGEITLSENFIHRYFNTTLKEKSIFVMNLYKIFPGKKDYASLFPDDFNNISEKADYMQEFVVLNY